MGWAQKRRAFGCRLGLRLAFTRQRNAELTSRRSMLGGQRGSVSAGVNRAIFALRRDEGAGKVGPERTGTPREKANASSMPGGGPVVVITAQ
jgi:hypothetical protein